MKITILFSFLFTLNLLQGQTYTSWIVGDTSDVDTPHQPGLVLAGGGSDNDQAMTWMLNRAAGGDIVILRASGADGYNNYFFSDLGVTVNSVETLLTPSQAAANDPYVRRRIREAEVLFIAGGDQTAYFDFWNDSEVEDALQYLLSEKLATIGGTSAGMMVMGEWYYIPQNQGVTSQEALGNPFHPNMQQISAGGFLDNPILENTITDTHFDQRNRSGRSFAFLARGKKDWAINGKAIACNEVTVVCVDETGLARVYGEFPAYDDYAYFMQVNCFENNTPEICEPNKKLFWKRNRQVVKVYRVPGTITGTHTFDLNNWNTGTGGSWFDWFTTKKGQLRKISGALPPNCGSSLQEEEASIRESPANQANPEILLFPNPTEDFLELHLPGNSATLDWQIIGADGRIWSMGKIQGENTHISLKTLPAGVYWMSIQSPISLPWQMFVKK